MIGRKKFEGDRIGIRELKRKRRRQTTGERERRSRNDETKLSEKNRDEKT